MREFSTNTILFKTWGNAHDVMMPDPDLRTTQSHDPSMHRLERGNTFFPVRRIKKLPPKELYVKTPPKPPMGYSKGLLIKEPYNMDRKRALINDRKINGPIQLSLYSSPKNDQLQPLVLPSIKYVGFDIDKIDTYVQSRKMKMAVGTGKGDVTKAILSSEDYARAQQLQQAPAAGRIIIHSSNPESTQQVTLMQVRKS